MDQIDNYRLLAERAIVGIYNSTAPAQDKVEALTELSRVIETHIKAIGQAPQAGANLAFLQGPHPVTMR